MKRNFTTDDIEEILRRNASTAQLSQAARERIQMRLRVEVANVTTENHTRYKTQSGLIFQHKPMIASIIIAVVLLGSGTGTVLASNNAKPGDALFGLDQAIEQIQLRLTVSSEARLRLAAAIAEERAKELNELSGSEKQEQARAAAEHVNLALKQAAQTVTEVRDELEAKSDDAVAQTLTNTETTLRKIEDEQNSHSFQRIEIEVHVVGKQAKVNAEVANQHSEFVVEATDREEIIKAVSERLKLPIAQVRAFIKIEYDDELGNENTNVQVPELNNSNANNGNLNTNDDSKNTNVHSGGSDDNRDEISSLETSWEIEVRVRDNRAEIYARQDNAARYEWISEQTSVAPLAVEIAGRTGLSAAQVQAIWDFEIEN